MPTLQAAVIGAVATLLLALGAILLIQHLELKSAEAKYNNAVSREAALQTDNGNFKLLVDRQNKWIARLRTVQQARAAATAKAVAAARKNAEAYGALAAAIRDQQMKGDDCADARALLQTYLKGRK